MSDIPILWISVVYVWSLGVDCGGLARPKGGASPVFLTCTQQDCTTDSKPAHNKQRAHNKTARPTQNILKEHSIHTRLHSVQHIQHLARVLTCTQARQWRTFECNQARSCEECSAQTNTNTS